MTEFIQITLLLIIVGLLVRGNATKISQPAKSNGRKMILDSCALIDGRIEELNKLGFVPSELIVPDFVLRELQMLADGNDSHKRERARFGLDVVKHLQDADSAVVTIEQSDTTSRMPTDDKLGSTQLTTT